MIRASLTSLRQQQQQQQKLAGVMLDHPGLSLTIEKKFKKPNPVGFGFSGQKTWAF